MSERRSLIRALRSTWTALTCFARHRPVESASAFARDIARAIETFDPTIEVHRFQVLAEMELADSATLDMLRHHVESGMHGATMASHADPSRDILRLIGIPIGNGRARLLAVLDPVELYENASLIEDFGEREIEPDQLGKGTTYTIP